MGLKKIKFQEGQWFAVPLVKGSYALGICVRGNYMTNGCLGYFFSPRYESIPGEKEIWEKYPKDAILIAKFSDVGITRGYWPLIQNIKPFIKEEWAIPRFGSPNPLIPELGFMREYEQGSDGSLRMIRETVVEAKEIANLPDDGFMGYGFVEIRLNDLLSRNQNIK